MMIKPENFKVKTASKQNRYKQEHDEDKSLQKKRPDEDVDRTIEESFPASDPPSWNHGDT